MRTFPKSSVTFKVLSVTLLLGAGCLLATDAITISTPGVTETPQLTPSQMFIWEGTSESEADHITVVFKKVVGEAPDYTYEGFWNTTTDLTLCSWSGMFHKPNVNWTPAQEYLFRVTNAGAGESATACRAFSGISDP